MHHFAHYVKRRVMHLHDTEPTSPEYAAHQSPEEGFINPVYHSIAINSGVAAKIEQGDTIWLFSRLSSPWGNFPPSLDGKIEVAKIDKNNNMPGRYRFDAGIESRWYPLYDASTLVSKISTTNAARKIQPLLSANQQTVGQALRFPREIFNPRCLIDHATAIEQMAPDFISYRIQDGTEQAFGLARRLIQNGRSVFWDRWSLPRRLSERHQEVDAAALDEHIMEIIRGSRVVWGVSSELYGLTGSYSQLEKQFSEQLGKFREFPPWRAD